MNLKHTLRALAHRNYRLYLFGQAVSLIGTWMQQVATSWLVFSLTHQSFDLGVVLFCGQIPALFLSPLAGVVADRLHRHRLLVLTQSLAMAQAFLLAALALSGVITVWQIIVLSVFLGVVNTFDMTTRQAFVTEMVTDRADLGNAIALNSSIVNGTRLVGPALAGLLLAATSPGVCFLVNGISYLAVLAALLAMRLAPRAEAPHRGAVLQGLREGFRYAFGFAPIRSILLLLAVSSMVGTSYGVLLPAFTEKVLHGDAATYGFLSAAVGVGALAGALFLASRTSILGLGRWITVTPALLGLGLIGFAFATHLWVGLLLLAVIGFAMMVQMASSNTLLQTIVEEDKRGRVMSFYTMAFLGMAPLGSLLTGSLSAAVGLPATFVINGLICVSAAAVFALRLPRLRTLVRPIYVQLHILPEVAAGLQSATELTLETKA